MAPSLPQWLAAGGCVALAAALLLGDAPQGGLGWPVGMLGAAAVGLGSVLMVAQSAQPARRHD